MAAWLGIGAAPAVTFFIAGCFRVFAKTAMTLFIYFMRRLGYATGFLWLIISVLFFVFFHLSRLRRP